MSGSWVERPTPPGFTAPLLPCALVPPPLDVAPGPIAERCYCGDQPDNARARPHRYGDPARCRRARDDGRTLRRNGA